MPYPSPTEPGPNATPPPTLSSGVSPRRLSPFTPFTPLCPLPPCQYSPPAHQPIHRHPERVPHTFSCPPANFPTTRREPSRPTSPIGTTDHSPPFQRWVPTPDKRQAPQGRKRRKTSAKGSCRPGWDSPDGCPGLPAMNRWAIVLRPPGWGRRTGDVTNSTSPPPRSESPRRSGRTTHPPTARKSTACLWLPQPRKCAAYPHDLSWFPPFSAFGLVRPFGPFTLLFGLSGFFTLFLLCTLFVRL